VLEQNYADSEFGVTELSDAMGMNKTALSKRINTETGLPTSQFIRNYRLDVAKKLISRNASNRNITEIAYSVGFNDPKYFTRCFTKLYGISPSSYKAENDAET
jgi:AraC-like DNA-binding protein